MRQRRVLQNHLPVYNQACNFRAQLRAHVLPVNLYQSTLLPIEGLQVPRQILLISSNEEPHMTHARCGNPVFEVLLSQSLTSRLATFDENNIFGLGNRERNYLIPRKPGYVYPHCG
jgi:hypothetical protein